jgi:hypothetical protein
MRRRWNLKPNPHGRPDATIEMYVIIARNQGTSIPSLRTVEKGERERPGQGIVTNYG